MVVNKMRHSQNEEFTPLHFSTEIMGYRIEHVLIVFTLGYIVSNSEYRVIQYLEINFAGLYFKCSSSQPVNPSNGHCYNLKLIAY